MGRRRFNLSYSPIVCLQLFTILSKSFSLWIDLCHFSSRNSILLIYQISDNLHKALWQQTNQVKQPRINEMKTKSHCTQYQEVPLVPFRIKRTLSTACEFLHTIINKQMRYSLVSFSFVSDRFGRTPKYDMLHLNDKQS